MKSFKDFLKVASVIAPMLIPVAPVHGRHSKPKKDDSQPTLIPVDPVHGAHSVPPIKESDESGESGLHHYGDYLNHNPNPHLGSHVDFVHDALNKSDEDFKRHYVHHSDIKEYTLNSHDANSHLLQVARGESGHLSHKPNDDDYDKRRKDRHHEMIHGLDKEFSHPNSDLEHDVTVLHGTSNWHPGELASQHPQRLIKSAPFMSTTIKPEVSTYFSGAGNRAHVLRIHLKGKKDTHGNPRQPHEVNKGIYIGGNSYHQHEHEMLLPRNTTLHVHHTPEKLSNGVHIWDAHVVHHDDNQLELPLRHKS